MDRRFITAVILSLLFALVVSAVFYRMVSRRTGDGRRRNMVVASKALPPGVVVKREDLRVTKVPGSHFPKGAFDTPEDVIDRPVINAILADEPISEGRLAPKGAGFGLAPMIPPGMRAASVRVDDVVGVGGFALPGMRVDVVVTGHPPGKDRTVARTVLQNIAVLSAGRNLEPDARGRSSNVSLVTLLVDPEQAETLTLAANEGRIQLVLRNGMDGKIHATRGRELGDLYGSRETVAAAPVVPRSHRVDAAKPLPSRADPQPARVQAEIVVIRGSQKTTEHVALRQQGE